MNLHYVEDKETAKQLIESVTLDERENLILLFDENQYTALHEAAANGKTDVVEYLCSLPLKDELILAKDNKGETALHFSINQKIAQLLVESVVPEKQRYFILSVTKDKLTALHVAAANGRTDVVEYLCSLSIIDDELILKKDAKGWTPLHYAENREVAKLLVESVLPENQKDFILSVARNHCTALHVAAESGRTNVVEYLCSLSDGDLILKRDKDEYTALHYAENKDIAKLLIESVRPERQKYLALSVDKKQRTALHRAAHKNRVDVVEYLCSLSEGSEELILKSDSGGWTALYCVHNEQIAKILVESVTPEHLKEFLLFVDKSQRTALHVMVLLGRADVVEYLCGLYSNDGQLFLRKDSHGRTVLHCAEKKVITKLLVNSVTPEIQKYFILSVDNDQCTALHLAAENGRADVVEFLCSLSLANDELILKKDSSSSTALHYAGNKEIAKLLVESVTPTERRSLIFSVTESQCTALHTAAKGNRIGVVEYLCSMYPSSDELILKVDNEGRTALHLAQSRIVAELLVKSLPPERQESFVFLTDENEFTALHTAAISGKIDVIKYFSSLDIDLSSLLTKEDCFGRTALHYAKSRDIAKLLIESLAPSKRHDFIVLADEHQCTALHLAALSSRIDVVEMLCHSASDQLLLRSDSDGWTALHIAKTKEIAQLLVESVAPEKRKDFILSVDDDQRTALHLAAGSGLTDVVEYLCSFNSMFDGFILQRDVEGCTALHLAKTGKIAEILVDSFPRIEQETFLLAANKNMRTSLHMAVSFRRVSVVEYLSNYHSTRLLAAVDANGQTALHLANDEESVEIMMKSLNSNTLEQLLACEDLFGHTPVLLIISLGNSGALKMLLECVKQNCDLNTMAALLQKQNNSNQNIWHLAALSPFLGDLYNVLQEYSFFISNIENLMQTG